MSGLGDPQSAAGDFAGLPPGFAEPVHDAQACFRTILDGLAHPGRIQEMPVSPAAGLPSPLGSAAASVALTLCDIDTKVWLDDKLTSASSYIAFHCGAAITADAGEASFALVADPADLPPLDAFSLGTDQYPERSTTLVIEVAGLVASYGVRISGPGIRDTARLGVAGLPARFWSERAALNELFPRGVDVLFVSGTQFAALPRSTRIAF
jgi:alpha-D-ribose 1-methylphosphonate 5-triphosphate synthase subunit PhnH